MKIKLSNLNKLTRWEVFQLLADALAFADAAKEGMTEMFLTTLDELKVKFNALDDALLQERNLLSEEIIAAEEGRDYDVRKLYALISEYADYKYDAGKETAARFLFKFFRSYGTGNEIAQQRQDTETAVITNLVQDLEKEPAGQHLATLGLEAVVASLKANNTTFAEARQSRHDEQSQIVTGAVKTARSEAQAAFKSFCETVNALAIVEGAQKYEKIISQLNTLISDYLSRTRTQKNKETETETETET